MDCSELTWNPITGIRNPRAKEGTRAAECLITLAPFADEEEPPRLRSTVVNSVERLSPGSSRRRDRTVRKPRKEREKLLDS